MLISCPTCGKDVAITGDSVTTAAVCMACGRTVVARDAITVPPSPRDGTVPYEPLSRPSRGRGDATAVKGRTLRPALPRDGRVSIAVLNGPRQGDVFVLDRPRIIIGRSGNDADFEVPDPEVSRHHAAVECFGPQIRLRDLDSRNGTFLGRKRVSTSEIGDRSEFRLGVTRFMLIVTERG